MKAQQLIMTWLLWVSMNSCDGGPVIFGRFHEQTNKKKTKIATSVTQKLNESSSPLDWKGALHLRFNQGRERRIY